MREQLQRRLTALEAEFEAGQRQLEELEKRSQDIRHTLLRISGAIQVLREELSGTDPEAPMESLNVVNGQLYK